jgi:transcriptional regulator with XRE-family HTH domain
LDSDLKRIADRIRSWRDEAGFTLQQLGDQAGVSASTIHKIENLQTVPTIAVLLKVAHGLNRRPSELLSEIEAEKQAAVLHRGDRQELVIQNGARAEHLAAMIPRNRLDAWRVHLEPGIGAGANGEAWQFHGEVILLVEAGTVEAEIGTEDFELAPGDSIHFDPSVPHSWYATGESTATVIVMALLPDRLQGDLISRTAMSAKRAKASPDHPKD